MGVARAEVWVVPRSEVPDASRIIPDHLNHVIRGPADTLRLSISWGVDAERNTKPEDLGYGEEVDAGSVGGVDSEEFDFVGGIFLFFT